MLAFKCIYGLATQYLSNLLTVRKYSQYNLRSQVFTSGTIARILQPYNENSCETIGETGRNLSTRLTEHKRATRNGGCQESLC